MCGERGLISHFCPVGLKAAEVVEVRQSIGEPQQAQVSFSSEQLQTLIVRD